MQQGELFVLSAPSGTGKNTLIRALLDELERLEHSISYTTRRPRPGEIDGRDYHFVDRRIFEEMIAAGAFLEWAEYNESYYGTAAQEVDPRLRRGVDVILDIEVQGTERLLQRRPEAHAILLLPPSFEALRARLAGRGLDDSHAIARRLSVSRCEIERYSLYHYAIINDDLQRASQALAAIILEKRFRVERQEEKIGEVLRDFEQQSTRER